MNSLDQIDASSIDKIPDDPPSTEEAKKRIAALGLGGPRTCVRCGQLRKGRISDYRTSSYGFDTKYFVCFNCLVKDESKALAESDEFIRKDRVWRIRKAREIWMNKRISEPVKSIDPRYLADELPYQTRSEDLLMQNTLTEEEKEELAKKLMATLDPILI